MAPEVDVRDVLVSAQTGSGKTVAFGLALAKTLLGEAERFTPGGAPRALIVTPTRELAMQVHRELSWLYAETGARITTCVGGMDPRRESHLLGQGVHIVVGTPGRLCDHLSRGSLVLDRLAAVVLDEADEMLDMGFREDLERLLEAAPAERRTLMFSATIAPPIATLAKRFQRNALRVATASEGAVHRDISYEVVSVVPRERDLAVVNLLRYHDAPGALVFCGTRDGVAHLAANLSERGFSVAALSGELSQRERNQALQALRDGRARVCVATDVAARGLDLPDLGLVIHADLPQNKETMVHRSGRTGRAGKKGLAILIAVDAARRFVERLLWSARVEATWRLPPSSDDIRARDQQQLAGEIEGLTGEVSDADRDVARALLAERSAEDLVAALVRVRREARPAPEELTVPMSMRPRGSHDRRDDRDRPGVDRDRPRYGSVVRGRDERSARVGEPERPGNRFAGSAERAERVERAERGASAEGAAAAVRVERGASAEGAAAAVRVEQVDASDGSNASTVGSTSPSPSRSTFGDNVNDNVNGAPRAVAPSNAGRATGASEEGRARPAAQPRPHRPEREARAPRATAERSQAEVETELVELLGGTRDTRDARKQVWFTINIGRSKNADPKWIVPLLCRRGGISKNAIGKIQIFARETRVEISHDVSERFAAAVRQPDTQDRNIHIEPLDALAQ